MAIGSGKIDRELSLKSALLEAARQALRTDASLALDPPELYRTAVADLVGRLLSQNAHVGELHSSPEPLFPSMSPDEVGQAYEYLRGFRIQLAPGAEPELVPSIRSKRNQGLFYTPPQVVRFMVKTALDELRVQRPEDYLELKILDPAVGTGVFLVEALEQIANRVLIPGWSNISSLRRQIEDIIDQASGRFATHAKPDVPDAHAAVRMHVLEHCLYGVDLDPIAVAIAGEALLARACQALSPWPRFRLKIRVGNSLIGEGRANSDSVLEEELHHFHARAYLGRNSSQFPEIAQWCKSKGIFHWPLEYPEVFRNERAGFDAIFGNPPYEIVSVKESGISDRTAEQRYFRRMYRTCRGKINTYRLMLERGLNLLSARGTLGFILPATLIADSTATDLRKTMLEESEITYAVLIPEKARVFHKVTQALVVLVLRKGRKTTTVRPAFWHGKGSIPEKGEVEISRALIDATGSRIPLLRSEDEKRLLELISGYPPFKGTDQLRPVGRVHQGEINLTTHRRFITAQKTDFPLIRGEHVMPFRVAHPSSRPGRLDWVIPEYARNCMASGSASTKVSISNGNKPRSGLRETPCEKERIVLGRVVNMATSRRLKAASVPAGVFLGDMTNFIADFTVPRNYLLGLLNSRLLNWRLKLTSTNNYISAAEIELLPIPRIPNREVAPNEFRRVQELLKSMLDHESISLSACLENVRLFFGPQKEANGEALLPGAIEWLVEEILRFETASEGRKTILTNLLDALVLNLYGIEPWPGLVRVLESP